MKQILCLLLACMTLTVNAQFAVNGHRFVASTDTVNVNLYTTNTYSNSEWNNWSLLSGSQGIQTSGTLNYKSGASSGITITQSAQSGTADNGSPTGTFEWPGGVLKWVSYHSVNTTYTINNLDNSKLYDLYFVAFRSTNTDQTTYTINGVSKTAQVHNVTPVVSVSFTNIAPSSNQIVVTRARVGTTFSYTNAMKIIVKTKPQ